MMKFNREEGLTLIELLITIAVLAIVAAIAVPVVTNVVNSTSDRAVEQTNSDVAAFVEKYNNTGVVAYDADSQTFYGYVDLNGSNEIEANDSADYAAAGGTEGDPLDFNLGIFTATDELVEQLSVDETQFEDADNVGTNVPDSFGAPDFTDANVPTFQSVGG